MPSDLLLTAAANPTRMPNWRWERARLLRERPRTAKTSDDDGWVQEAKNFQSNYQACQNDREYERLAARDPGIYWAREINQNSNRIHRWVIEAFLLARAEPQLIAEISKTEVEVVTWYEKLFFNVIPYLGCDMYIATTIIGESAHYGLNERDFDVLWKMLGYGIGAIFLREYVAPIQIDLMTDINQYDLTLDKHAIKKVNKKALISAQTIPCYGNQEVIFNAWNKLREIEKSSTGGGRDNMIAQNIQATMTALPFTVGQDLPNELASIESYNAGGIELRASEQLQLAAGQEPDLLKIWRYPIPQLPASGDQKVG